MRYDFHSKFFISILFVTVSLAGCAPIGSSTNGPHTRGSSAASHRPPAPILKRLHNGHYRVLKPWTVNIGGRKWHIQKGYTCNGITAKESIKKSLGDGIEHPETWAAVFHDWLFTQPGVSRATADQLFYDILIAYGVSPIKARMMYSYVAAYSARKTLR